MAASKLFDGKQIAEIGDLQDVVDRFVAVEQNDFFTRPVKSA
jgi:hypothetical protein